LKALQRLAVSAFGASQIAAACQYSPPPLLNQGQGADTLGDGRLALAAEAGYGTAASFWQRRGLSNPEVTSGAVGAGRIRYGLGEAFDVGLAGGYGPEHAFVVGPELKWRFAHLSPSKAADAPAFDAALLAGVGVGAADYRYGSRASPRHVFVAPYQGLTASGGVPLIQMFVGLRLAESETLGNEVSDLTLYPVLAFGVQVRPAVGLTLYAETDLAGGITTADTGDSALLFYPTLGASFTFDTSKASD
jgi:hypothetical protein